MWTQYKVVQDTLGGSACRKNTNRRLPRKGHSRAGH